MKKKERRRIATFTATEETGMPFLPCLCLINQRWDKGTVDGNKLDLGGGGLESVWTLLITIYESFAG